MRISIYALGGGMGHVTRALAFSRVALQAGHRVQVLVNSVDAQLLLSAARGSSLLGIAEAVDTVHVLPATLSPQQTSKLVTEWLDRSFDVLLVDTFPRGLGGELAEFVTNEHRPVFLVHRNLSKRYVESRNIRTFATAFQKIFLPGEAGPLADSPNAVKTSPWLICDPHELLHPHAARDALRAQDANRPTVLVVGSGREEEVADAEQITGRLREKLADAAHIRFASLQPNSQSLDEVSVSLWPLMRFMRGVDVLIGAGGYNTVNEARATQTSLLSIPRVRLYDRQHQRLDSNERQLTADELVSSVVRLLASDRIRTPSPQPAFENGVHAALREVELAL